MKRSSVALLLGVTIALGTAGYFYSRHQNAPAVPPAAGSEALSRAVFSDLAGKQQALAQWRGKVMVVNFWATWCPPCRTEIPEFVKMQEKYREKGLIFVGIAIDQKDKVQAFADEVGVNYPLLLGELEAVELSRQTGNRLGGLPYTVILDRAGKIVAAEMGEVNQAKLESLVKPLF